MSVPVFAEHVVNFASFPKFDLKGRCWISAQKLQSAACVFSLQTTVSLSLELVGDKSVDVTSTCSDCTMMILGARSRNDVLMLSPFLSMLAPVLYLMVFCSK